MFSSKLKKHIGVSVVVIGILAIGIFALVYQTKKPTPKTKISAATGTATIRIQPENVTLPPQKTVQIWATVNKPVGFIDIEITFDKSKLMLTKEPVFSVSSTNTVSLTDMATANTSGRVTFVAGVDPTKISTAPNGTFQVGSFEFTNKTNVTGGTTMIDVSTTESQFVDMDAVSFTLSGISSTVTLPSSSTLTATSTSVATSTPAPTTPANSIIGDVNNDGYVNMVDIGLVVDNYGSSNPTNVKVDVNNDGIINIIDIGIVVDHYGETQISTPIPNVTNPPTAAPAGSSNGIWISQGELMSRPTTGSAWQTVLSDAGGSWGSADVSNQDSNHDQKVLAGALVCARTGQYCDKTRQALVSAIGTEEGARWLAIGRNVLGYTIAADVMKNSGNLTGSELNSVSSWLANFLTRTLAHNNSGEQIKLTPFASGSNASAQEGAVYAAIAAYMKDMTKLTYAWNRFRLYSCDRVDNPEQTIDVNKGFEGGWSFTTDLNQACAVNPKDTTKDGHRIDGAVINDIVRGGSFKWPPSYTGYEMTGLQGYVSAAVVFHRAGFPSFDVKDQAVLRAMDYVCYLENNTTTNWWETNRGRAIMHLVKVAYNYNPAGCQYSYPVGAGMVIGYTDWTHQ